MRVRRILVRPQTDASTPPFHAAPEACAPTTRATLPQDASTTLLFAMTIMHVLPILAAAP